MGTDIFFEKTSYATGDQFLLEENSPLSLEKGGFWIRPSDIVDVADGNGIHTSNFTCAFGQCEAEITAYLICEFFKKKGNMWFAANIAELSDYVDQREKEIYKIPPWNLKLWVTEFAFRRDYAVISEGKMTFTNVFVERCAGFRAKDELERDKVQNVFEMKKAS